MLVSIIGIAANDPARSEAPKAQPFTYVQGSSLRVALKVLDEDGAAHALGTDIPTLATVLQDGSALQLAFTVDSAPDGLAHLAIAPGTVLIPGIYAFEVYLDNGAGGHDPIVAESLLTVKASAIPTS